MPAARKRKQREEKATLSDYEMERLKNIRVNEAALSRLGLDGGRHRLDGGPGLVSVTNEVAVPEPCVPLRFVRYEPESFDLADAHVDCMLQWIGAVQRVDGVHKTDEAALRAATVFAAIDATGRLVAFAALALSTPYLLELHAHEDWRRQGYGSRLVALVKKAAAAAFPSGRLRLTVADGNSPAIRLYSKAGFKLVGDECEEGYSIFEYSLA